MAAPEKVSSGCILLGCGGGGNVGAGPAVDGQGMRDCAGRGGVRRGVCFMLEGDVDVMRWQQRLRGWCP